LKFAIAVRLIKKGMRYEKLDQSTRPGHEIRSFHEEGMFCLSKRTSSTKWCSHNNQTLAAGLAAHEGYSDSLGHSSLTFDQQSITQVCGPAQMNFDHSSGHQAFTISL